MDHPTIFPTNREEKKEKEELGHSFFQIDVRIR
jgi:hypothetical protein